MKKLILLALAAGFVSIASFSAPAQAQSCREGEEVYFDEYNGGEGTERVLYICRNGKYVKKHGNNNQPEPTYPGCKEGSTEYWCEADGSESGKCQYYVCRDGRYSPLYPSGDPAPAPTYPGCKEGQREIWLESDGDSMRQVEYVCRGGKFVPANR